MNEIENNLSNINNHQGGTNINYSVITIPHQQSHFITKGEIIDNTIKDPKFDLKNFEPILDNNNSPLSIGKGTFSTIYLYENKQNKKKYAIKHIYKDKIIESTKSLSIAYKEIDIHSRFIHQNIIRLYSYEENETSFNLILEYAPNGNLFQLIQKKKSLSENECFAYFIQTIDAIYFLHENNIIHRDIKPENLLLFNKSKIKLCDFGWSTELEIANRTTFCGTIEYMAPEIIKEESYEKSVDIWALGILLYEMYYGFSPFKAIGNFDDGTKEVLNNILNNSIIFPNEKIIDSDMKSLILKMIEKKGKKRISIKEIFEHPWVKKFEYKMYGSLSNENVNDKKSNLNNNKNVNIKEKNNDLYNKSSSVTNIFDDKEKKDKAFFDNVMKNTKPKKKNRKFSKNNRLSANNQNDNNDYNEYSYLNNNLYKNKDNANKIPLYINPKYEININKVQKNQRKNHFEELKDRENILNNKENNYLNYKLNINNKSQSYQKKTSADVIYPTQFNMEISSLQKENDDDFISSINESHLIPFRKSKKIMNSKKNSYLNSQVQEAIKIIDESQNVNENKKVNDENQGIFCCTFFNCNKME